MNIKAKLKENGTSLRRWALENGYAPRTVHAVVRRWEHRADRQPHGGIARQIMVNLRHVER